MDNPISILGSAIDSYPLPILQKRGDRIGITDEFADCLLEACEAVTRKYAPFTCRQMHCTPPRNKTGMKGVYRNGTEKKPYKARIYSPKSNMFISLGYYETKEEAGRAYDEYAKKMYPNDPDLFLNFPH